MGKRYYRSGKPADFRSFTGFDAGKSTEKRADKLDGWVHTDPETDTDLDTDTVTTYVDDSRAVDADTRRERARRRILYGG